MHALDGTDNSFYNRRCVNVFIIERHKKNL